MECKILERISEYFNSNLTKNKHYITYKHQKLNIFDLIEKLAQKKKWEQNDINILDELIENYEMFDFFN